MPSIQIAPPADAALLCPKPAPLKKPATMGDLYKNATDLKSAYKVCAARHRALVEWSGGLAK